MERKIKAGELQNVQAVEGATRRNVEMILTFSNDTRKMLFELRELFDSLQNHVMTQYAEIGELRGQLAALQQQFYAKGTVSYSDGD